MSMTRIFVLIALVTAIVAPASAQYDPTTPARQRSSRVHVYAPDVARDYPGYQRNSNLNPDFQLGGSRWKTNSKSRHARKHGSASQK